MVEDIPSTGGLRNQKRSRDDEGDDGASDLYLDTIDRRQLDFDFEKLCSVSLADTNVYACLVCGKYFQGRGKNSHAYFHSVDVDHHVYINMATLKIYVLPEGYQVKSHTLDDIKYAVEPEYTMEQVNSLDKVPRDGHDLNHKTYYPGFVGLNNIKQNDYANVILLMLAHVSPIRDFFLKGYSGNSELARRLGLLIRKLWSARLFKGHVSPHELLQYVAEVSKKRYTPVQQADPFAFMTWLLNTLHRELSRVPKAKTLPPNNLPLAGDPIVFPTFQGKLRVESQKITSRAVPGDRLRFEADTKVDNQYTPFLSLSLDLPPAPLFKNALDADEIPEISLTELLRKYNGTTTQELVGHRKRFRIVQLPEYLILYIKRLSKSAVSDAIERNPTVVRYPVFGLDMSPYTDQGGTHIYDLIANISYEWNDAANRPRWRAQVKDKARDSWFQIEDLRVERVREELLFLSESYIQVWHRRQ
jgi:U4/U6.U5 tri-snRNP-associated protein 2